MTYDDDRLPACSPCCVGPRLSLSSVSSVSSLLLRIWRSVCVCVCVCVCVYVYVHVHVHVCVCS